MADVFISYSNKDFDIAQALAADLQASGYDVWWDYRLVGGAKFRDTILSELKLARSVVVIWSDHSVGSEFVVDEADEARRANKLVSTSVGNFPIERLPLGFRNRHTIPVADKDRVKLALDTLCTAVPVRASIGKSATIDTPQDSISIGSPGFQAATEKAANNDDDKFAYAPYRSDVLGVLFEYPSRILTLDTTRYSEGRFELVSDSGETEVRIFPSEVQLPCDIRAAQEAEQRELEEKGCRITYKAPQLERNWDNWYVLSGLDTQKNWFYYRRWATSMGLISIEYNFHGSRMHVYKQVITHMTLRKFKFIPGSLGC